MRVFPLRGRWGGAVSAQRAPGAAPEWVLNRLIGQGNAVRNGPNRPRFIAGRTRLRKLAQESCTGAQKSFNGY